MGRPLAAALLLLTAACSTTRSDPDPPPPGPYVLVLGTAQDGGLPQIGCELPCCERARANPAERRYAASVLLCDPRTGSRWLFDAGPDLREQVELASGHPPTRALEGARPPLFEGVFLTHAHMGHYTGLVHLGKEAYGTKGLVAWSTPRMCALLEDDAPWSQLVSEDRLVPTPLADGDTVQLADDLAVTAVAVPHRDELSGTFAWRIQGPDRALLFLPDIDKWERWERAVEDELALVDVALLDGTFFGDGEVPGRSMAEIPHPFIEESLARFGTLSAEERAKVRFFHLNHTNPAVWPGSEADKAVRRAGMAVAREGELHALGATP